MKTYDLYVESGPKMRKTVVHVPALAGCSARGDTTDEALAAAPEAIGKFLRFLQRHGERVDGAAPFKTRVAAMMLAGGFLGSVFLETDLKPLTKAEIAPSLRRLGWIHGDLRRLTAGLTSRQLDGAPPAGRAIRKILAHICSEGGYLRGVSGAARIQREVDDGRLNALDALDRLLSLESERLHAMNAAERAEVVTRGQAQWTARSAVREMLHHGWEHYVEIADRLSIEP